MRREQIGGAIMSATVLLPAALTAPQASRAATMLSIMDNGWKLWADGGSTTREASYSEDQFTSAPKSIRLYLQDGGANALDHGRAIGEKYLTLSRVERLKMPFRKSYCGVAFGGAGGRHPYAPAAS